MLDVFAPVKSIIKLDKVSIDNAVFRLHYKATMAIMVAFSMVVSTKQYFGDPIDCLAGKDIGREVMDAYCWLHGTYTLPYAVAEVGIDAAHPGVSQYSSKTDIKKYHKYYQWVGFVLIFQALLFYIPRYLWKSWEGGKIKMLLMNLDCPLVDEENKMNQKKLILDYFIANMKYQNSYAWRFFFCEVLNFINVVGQIFFMDVFLGYEFTTYGSQVLSFTEDDPFNRIDPMSRIFPKVTKCVFNKYGPSGNIIPNDSLCVLPVNVINEKIYVFLWFWFIIISVISGVSLVYRIFTICIPSIRMHLLGSKARIVNSEYYSTIGYNLQIGDWFILYQLGRNMDPLNFRELVHDLGERLDGKHAI